MGLIDVGTGAWITAACNKSLNWPITNLILLTALSVALLFIIHVVGVLEVVVVDVEAVMEVVVDAEVAVVAVE